MKHKIIAILKLMFLAICMVIVGAGCGCLVWVVGSVNEIAGVICMLLVAVCLSVVIYKLAE